MYNRYIRNDRGDYTRRTEPDGPPPDRPAPDSRPPRPTPEPSRPGPPPPSPPQQQPPPPQPPDRPPPPPPRPPSPPPPKPEGGPLRRFLDEAHLEQVDGGDLLLLGLLFLLSREGADEELLAALGLLLIL